jgi:N-acetylglucosaminyldiphosphoundecaprenol N-acetyl-beta-D-mannosaminyltransferase
MPLVWLAKLKGIKTAGRLYGPTLMDNIINYGRSFRLRHFFYGGTEVVLKKLTATMAKKYPGFLLAGTFVPPFRDLTASELQEFITAVEVSHADVLWLGIGSWRQVMLAAKIKNQIKIPLIIPVGAAFDFLSGTKKQAPAFFQTLGLEWCYRLLQEPERLWRRYLLQIPVFIVFSLLELINYLKQPKKISNCT